MQDQHDQVRKMTYNAEEWEDDQLEPGEGPVSMLDDDEEGYRLTDPEDSD